MGWPDSVAKKKHALIVDAQALRALNAISKDVLFGVGPVPTENSIMATHDRGLTTAVAIPSAKQIRNLSALDQYMWLTAKAPEVKMFAFAFSFRKKKSTAVFAFCSKENRIPARS